MPAKSTPMTCSTREGNMSSQDSDDDELNKMSCGSFLVNPLYNPVVLR